MAYTFKHGDRPVDGYTIQRAVGRGGFGEVYYAISDGGREVAVKYLRDNPQIELRGVGHCINLKSPHLVAIFDVKKTTDGEYAIIMEYCSGPSLRDLLIAEPNGFTPQKAAFFVREIAKGLAYLHDRGIVHRDLKPGNIFYDDGYVKIGDYGLSKFISVSRHSVQTASVGTVHYMAPEIGSGNYSRGIDIYALGVMLYEMLLGKVPFEGSTMAEVLMKHLTVQPELDNLPQPFGRVIRKALQKDPKDRYQNVDEMIAEILDVEEVRDSLAGFHPRSLEGAVRRQAGERHDSPMPSPNPAPNFGPRYGPTNGDPTRQPPFATPVEELNAMSKRTAKRMNRISRKFDAKMAKLEGRKRRPKPHKHVPRPVMHNPIEPADRKKRMLLSGLLSVGLAVGLGILVGNSVRGTHGEEWGAAAGMLVIEMVGAVLLARWAVNWFGVVNGPRWPKRIIQLCCAMPLLAPGAAPLLAASRHVSDAGLALWFGLIVVVVFSNWERTLETAVGGEMRFRCAIWKGIHAMIVVAIAAGIVGARPPEYVIMTAAGVAGATTLILQSMAWWLPSKVDRAVERLGPRRDDIRSGPDSPPPVPPFADKAIDETTTMAYVANRTPEPVAAHGPPLSHHMDQRWGITRAFWGLVAFALMGGTIVTFLVSLIVRDIDPHARTAIIIACTGNFAFMLFALRKTSPLRREGFWQESALPFLQSTLLFGMGGTITAIAREWHHQAQYFNGDVSYCLSDEGRVALVAGLALCFSGGITLTLFSRRWHRSPKPFFRGIDSDIRPGDKGDTNRTEAGEIARANAGEIT